jgi:GT2 family glycosyltransferase
MSPLDVVVVDNGSTDGTATCVRSEFPGVALIENGENLGITGRNIGYRAARGKIILSLDDDIELADPNTLSKICAAFDANPSLGAVTLKLLEEESGAEFVPHHWWHPRERSAFQDREFETDRINEAAVAFDAEAIKKAGYYYEALFWGGEEWDLVLGLLDEGYSIRYLPVSVMHLAPRGNMNFKADYRQALLVRNRFWIALRRLGPLDAMLVVMPRLLLWLVRAIRYGYLKHYLRGLLDLVRRLPQIYRERRPISAQTKQRVRDIRARR